jgi:hypothetical protein
MEATATAEGESVLKPVARGVCGPIGARNAHIVHLAGNDQSAGRQTARRRRWQLPRALAHRRNPLLAQATVSAGALSVSEPAVEPVGISISENFASALLGAAARSTRTAAPVG